MTLREQAISGCVAALERSVNSDLRPRGDRMALAALERLREATGAEPGLCAYQPLGYTSEPPTKPGAYWCDLAPVAKHFAFLKPIVLMVCADEKIGDKLYVYVDWWDTPVAVTAKMLVGAQWSGPLEPPG